MNTELRRLYNNQKTYIRRGYEVAPESVLQKEVDDIDVCLNDCHCDDEFMKVNTKSSLYYSSASHNSS